MPLLRRTVLRARDGRSPTWPRMRSMSSLATGALGRKAPVRVMYATVSAMGGASSRVLGLTGGVGEVGTLAGDALPCPRGGNTFDQRGDRRHGEDHDGEKH